MTDKVFADGLIVKAKHENAPEWVRDSLSFKVDEFILFLQKHADNGWVNVQTLTARSGKPYAALDTFKPNQGDVHDQGLAKAKASLDNSVPAGFDDLEEPPF
jgi:hypothetical protein